MADNDETNGVSQGDVDAIVSEQTGGATGPAKAPEAGTGADGSAPEGPDPGSAGPSTRPADVATGSSSENHDGIEATVTGASEDAVQKHTVRGFDAAAPCDSEPFTSQQAPQVGEPAGMTEFDPPGTVAPAGNQVDLLEDVELNVKIELGRTRMLVEDVLNLNNGSVVELDKLAGDPVDVLVNDRLVARGEVLVLNDNFCVRINEIVSQRGEAIRA